MKLTLNKKEFETFLDLTRKINRTYKIIPVVWGSFGLSLIIGEVKKVEDIDILLPDKFVKERWKETKKFMESLDFKLINEHEHEFEKNKIKVAFAKYSDLITEIPLNSLQKYKIKHSEFYNLSAEQYLKIYKTFLNERFKINAGKVKADMEKIRLIEKFMKKKP